MALKSNRVAYTRHLSRSLVGGIVRYCSEHHLTEDSFAEAAYVRELGMRLEKEAERRNAPEPM